MTIDTLIRKVQAAEEIYGRLRHEAPTVVAVAS